MRKIDPAQLSGTIVTVPGLNTPGLLHHTRLFTPGEGADCANLNWLMPGDVTSSARASLYAGQLWSLLLRPNAAAAPLLFRHGCSGYPPSRLGYGWPSALSGNPVWLR